MNGGSVIDFFFLAMTQWQLGDKEQARQWYDKAINGIVQGTPGREDINNFRAEAEELLGIKSAVNPDEKEVKIIKIQE